MFIVEENVLWLLIGPPDQSGSHKNFSLKVQERSFNAPKKTPFTGNSFSLVFARIFDISINIHEYANEMSFISIHDINIFVIYGITGTMTSCHNDSFRLKFEYLWGLKSFFQPSLINLLPDCYSLVHFH